MVQTTEPRLGDLKRLPQHASDVWQLAIVRTPGHTIGNHTAFWVWQVK